ncbi:hypothetical protein DFH09DRAFT_1282051 [Mycena vulgaris]|nr:hypothetical protein DFH09DRAFT_1282051 [Mycena vulgaris]
MIAFVGLFTSLGRVFAGALSTVKAHREAASRPRTRIGVSMGTGGSLRRWAGPMQTAPRGQRSTNLPEEVLQCLREWLGVLEERGTVHGTSLGSLLVGVQAFEISLATLEQVLTTPLPFEVHNSTSSFVVLTASSVYIPHTSGASSPPDPTSATVDRLTRPFYATQTLISDFEWHTVPAVAVGAFVYLGFVAAGEEIELPFDVPTRGSSEAMRWRCCVRR